MIIAVTGTPGTGKTAVSRELSDLLGYDRLDVNEIAQRPDVHTAEDEGRGTTAVDVDSLVDALEQEVGGDAVLDGHLAHHFPADMTVVLRCRPDELRERLEAKGWSEEKVEENVEAEVLDLLLQQAVAERERVMEVDTTGKDAVEVAGAVQAVVEAGEILERYEPGSVSWDVVPE